MQLANKPIVWLDVETTGLSPTTHEMLEFAAIKEWQGQISTLTIKIKPQHIELAHPKALEVNGYTEAAWADALMPFQAAIMIRDFLAGCTAVAHNAKFDSGFVAALLERAGFGDRQPTHWICTQTIAQERLFPYGLKSKSLKNVCKFLDIPEENPVHRAFEGAFRCRAVYYKMQKISWWQRFCWWINNR